MPKCLVTMAAVILSFQSSSSHACEKADVGLQSPPGFNREAAPISFSNQTSGVIELLWVDFEGELRYYKKLQPGERSSHSAYDGYICAVSDSKGTYLGPYVVGQTTSEIIVQ